MEDVEFLYFLFIFIFLWGGGEYNKGCIQKNLEKEMSSYNICSFPPKFYQHLDLVHSFLSEQVLG